ncbi:allantoate amidohydrolase [Roseibium sp. TrichSKD4]|uniref:M20/M25/M40 family metallo-hydrolase n=1 Tax=Roseibium sp. TrichSKD4 TaxID=744980 RepID=UPI0001E5740F|nr:M20/M25/M40 family metallo-hydrolase [Roseibium sp. TrichSKD4]EFO29841.1 allantoate amidohydrolase [Roseibium sp. TrichSKD4]
MRRLRKELEAIINDIAAKHTLGFRVQERSWLSPVQLDEALAEQSFASAKALGYSVKRMPSGAGHDAQTMQALCPSTLVFIPSRNGISHAPEEHSDWADIEKGANVMLQTLISLAS